MSIIDHIISKSDIVICLQTRSANTTDLLQRFSTGQHFYYRFD